MKKSPIVSTIIRIVGIAIIAIGIVMTIIPMFNFNVFTFNLGRSMVFAFGFSFVGIFLIVISVIYKSLYSNNNNLSTDEISKKVKKNLEEEKIKKEQSKNCPYCDSPLDENTKKCPNCGAKVK